MQWDAVVVQGAKVVDAELCPLNRCELVLT